MPARISRVALPFAAAAALALPFAASGQLASPDPPAPYTLLDHLTIGGDGGWDYLLADSAAHRLYITHGPRVEVVDTKANKVIGAITGLHGTHGVALDADGKFGYISDGGGNAVVVFDRSSLSTVATIAAGTNPDAILYEPATKTVWAFNGRSKDASVIDTATRKVIATVALPGKPEFAQADGQGNIYNNIEDKNSIVRIDARAHTVTATWPTCESPSGLAIDTKAHRLFSVCDGKKMSVIDYTSGKQLATPAIGEGPDATAYSSKQKYAFASCGEGLLSVVNAGANGYPTIQTLTTQRGARTMAYDSATDRIYVVTAQVGPRPQPTADSPHPRPPIVPGSFQLLIIGPKPGVNQGPGL